MSTPTGPDEPTTGPTTPPPPSGGPAPPEGTVVEETVDDRDAEDRRALIAIGVVIAAVAIGLLMWWLLTGDDDQETVATNTTTTESTTTSEVTTTTEARTTAATADTVPVGTLSPEELATVVFPYDDTSRRFSDPVVAAGAFATELVGFTEPVLGAFAQGDARSGEVEVGDRPGGMVTTVLVRQFGPDDTWWVIGATTPDIVIEQPAPGGEVISPMQLRGSALAFEGTVEVHLHKDGELNPIASGVVTGGATGELQPFEGEIPFPQPDRAWGALVLRTISAQDGRVQMAAVQRVAFPR